MSLEYYIPSSPIPYRVLCHLPLSTVCQLKLGLNFLNVDSDDQNEKNPKIIRLLIYKNVDQTLIICRNLCRHAGGNFVRDIEDDPEIVRCTYHGWKLNAKTLKYTKPDNGFKQNQLTIERQEDGRLNILEALLYEPWINDPQEKQDLKIDELTLTYISYASIEIQSDGVKLITDPWLTGPSFSRGCWLLHQPPSDAYHRIANADAIFISKSDSDHFNLPTLRIIAKMNPNFAFIFRNLKSIYFEINLSN